MSKVEAFLTNCRIADGRLVDIGIAGGKFAVVGQGAAASSNSAPALDIGGDLVLPGLVDGHMHLDKTLTGLPWMGQAAGPTRMSAPLAAIDRETCRKPDPRMRRSRHDPPAHPCRHRSRKWSCQAGWGACRTRAL